MSSILHTILISLLFSQSRRLFPDIIPGIFIFIFCSSRFSLDFSSRDSAMNVIMQGDPVLSGNLLNLERTNQNELIYSTLTSYSILLQFCEIFQL